MDLLFTLAHIFTASLHFYSIRDLNLPVHIVRCLVLLCPAHALSSNLATRQLQTVALCAEQRLQRKAPVTERKDGSGMPNRL